MKSILLNILAVVFMIAMIFVGVLAGSLITKAISGETPVQMILRWREEDRGGSPGTPEPSDEPVEPADDNEAQPAPQPAASSSGNLGDYYVDIKGAAIVNDYDGNPALVVTYAWTNNSEETTSAVASVYPKAFQDGVQLSNAMIINSDQYEALSAATQVRPGTTIDVQTAFELPNQTSVVEFELSELISLSDDIVSMNFNPADLG